MQIIKSVYRDVRWQCWCVSGREREKESEWSQQGLNEWAQLFFTNLRKVSISMCVSVNIVALATNYKMILLQRVRGHQLSSWSFLCGPERTDYQGKQRSCLHTGQDESLNGLLNMKMMGIVCCGFRCHQIWTQLNRDGILDQHPPSHSNLSAICMKTYQMLETPRWSLTRSFITRRRSVQAPCQSSQAIWFLPQSLQGSISNIHLKHYVIQSICIWYGLYSLSFFKPLIYCSYF